MAAFAFASAISLLAAAPGATGGVVSLNLCTDELVLLVARPDQVRGVSYLSHLPEELALWRQARRYPANDGSMLAAAARRPALVVTMGSAGRDQARLAAAVGARLLVLPYPASLADIAASVRRVGRATGNVGRAEAIVASMRSAVRNAPGGAVDAMWLDGAGRTLSPSSLGAAWLRLAGLAQRSVAGDQVTLEAMLTRPPTVVVQSRYRAGQMSSATGWLRHPAARRVARARTLPTDGRRWTCAGPTLLPEILRLRRALAR
ncbi:MAG TPA: hypothetical protein VEZ48_01395 [Sphingomonadaceae bacterium]|nr:hypothetical protein [Sphingomonadaceae bacterium]